MKRRLADKKSEDWHFEWLTALNVNLKALKEITDKFQRELIAKRKVDRND